MYEGVLEDGTMVAVKRLEITRKGEKEFYSEIAILGTIHHWNLVQLLGFCSQGSHKILIYEHMPNSSLDRWLFDDSKISFLTWPIRFDIVLGTARGLAYLHQECQYKIIQSGRGCSRKQGIPGLSYHHAFQAGNRSHNGWDNAVI